MSQHKTGQSSLTDEQQKLYWERRGKGLRGQLGVAIIHRVVKDENNDEQRVAVGSRLGSLLSRGKSASRSQTVRANQKSHMRQQRKASSRGE